MKDMNNSKSEYNTEKLPVIVFGVGAAGEALYYACLENGIQVNAFTDNNFVKTKNLLFGLEIIHPTKLKEKFKDALFYISAADIADAIRQLNELGYNNWVPGYNLLDGFNLAGRRYNKTMDLVEHAVETVIFCHDHYMNPGKLYARSVDIVVTEKCSMKCADCSNLMQFYGNPQNFSFEAIMGWINAFCRNVDDIGEIRVIGGEPFMNKDCDRVVEALTKEPKIKKVVIYTNATIPLKQPQLDRMNHKKVIFMITDYDELSRSHEQVTKALEVNGIKYVSQKARGWTDCGRISRHNRTVEEQKDVFLNCCANKLFTIVDGKFYRCPFAANVVQLHAVPDFPNDYVNFMQGDVRQKLYDYMFNKEYMDICDWCNGRKISDTEIIPAIQTSKPLPYEREK